MNTASPKILERGEPPGLKNVFSQNKALRFLHKAEAKSKVNDVLQEGGERGSFIVKDFENSQEGFEISVKRKDDII